MSKRKDEDRWGPHSHCTVCGNAIPEGEKTCSDECAAKYEQELNKYKRQQRYNLLLIVGMAVLIVVFLFLAYY